MGEDVERPSVGTGRGHHENTLGAELARARLRLKVKDPVAGK